MTDNQITKSPHVYNDRAAYNRAKAAYQRAFVQFQNEGKPFFVQKTQNRYLMKRNQDSCRTANLTRRA